MATGGVWNRLQQVAEATCIFVQKALKWPKSLVAHVAIATRLAMGIPWKQWSDIAVLFCAVVTSLKFCQVTAASRGQRGFLLTTPIHISSFGVDNGIGFHGALMIVRDGDDRMKCSVEVLDMQSGFCRASCAFVDTRKKRVAVEKTDNPHSDVLGRFLEALVMSGSELHVAMIGAGTAKGDGD
ncbi:hypothetical protein EMIHUDRAFT_211628 [Emiliania huxleyi CCMP1516]|uniref:Uncharacterized protein n=2 Tax=Emiliania huxleyi TaxID=2903 RepID=A0A0D3IVY5_EMIH1|nr:hypothetical protein EMIHUDRAFT_211628 [Emiliania huxleyi CCMP1516]EOD15420.1 hypothetical protein EMIHUDRAFT_211628 [Emiliania huxleyi CCMP1516]|eukprot:XP_005767849.1 hypothetical protein EMIHUDRAFT_211628 [Emiliania huxleyi CCMP1516]